MTTMKEVIVYDRNGRIETESRTVDIPTPGATQVLIKVAVTGTNPKDWKVPMWLPSDNGTNSGDDIAGVVHSVGKDVSEFKPGDRVAAFHEMRKPSGSFAQYAIADAHTTFHLPAATSFEEAATIPLAAMTAVIGLYSRLGVHEPWSKQSVNPEASNGIIVYGGATSVGGFVLKLLKKADFHPVYVVAGKGADFAKNFIDESKGDKIFDYRQGNDALVKDMSDTFGDKKPQLAYDAVSEHGSYTNLFKVMDKRSKVTVVLPGKDYEGVPEGIEVIVTNVGDAHANTRELAAAWYHLFGLGLREGWFSGHPYEVVPKGLDGVEEALNNLREGKASAVKYVMRIDETPGLKA